jgi:zinc protease
MRCYKFTSGQIKNNLLALAVLLLIVSGVPTGLSPLLLPVLAQSPLADAAGGTIGAPVRELRFSNGLKVLLLEIHTTPLISVWSWYRVGSKDDSLGETGISHWVEHMNFKGTRDFSKAQMMSLVEKAGGYWNGYTSLDQTCYFSTLASSSLEEVLRMEAERMWLSQVAPEEVQSERSVIISELLGGENDSRNLLDIDITAAAFKLHPYRWPTIGWKMDLEQISRQQLYKHYIDFYHPGNAILVLAGDFDSQKAEPLLRKYFESIPSSAEPGRYAPREPVQEGERRLKLLKEGTTPYLEFAYRVPEILNDDFFSCLILDAALCGSKGINLLSSPLDANAGRSSRLYKALVDKKLATYINSSLLPTRFPFLYKIVLTLPDAGQFQPAEEAVYDELEKIKTYGLSERELIKARNQLLARHYLDQDSLTSRAHQLGFFESIASYSLLEQFESKLMQVSQDDLRRVAIRYFNEKSRTVGWFLPQAKPRNVEVEKLSSAIISKKTTLSELHRHLHPAYAAVSPAFQATENIGSIMVPHISLQPQRRIFSSGLIVDVVSNSTSPTFCLKAAIKAGAMRDGNSKAGLAWMTGQMLEGGTKTKTSQQLADTIEFLGADLEINTDYLATNLNIHGLSRDFNLLAETMSDMIRNPSFSSAEVDKARASQLSSLREDLDDPAAVAEATLRERIYPMGHPFRQKVDGTISAVESITAADLANFHKRFYRPDQLIIVVSGNLNPEEVFQKMDSLFGNWKVDGAPESFYVAAVQPGLGAGSQVVNMAAKSQCEIVLGRTGISIHHPDYYAMLILNYLMGESGLGGRIGSRVRDQEGLAYHVSSSLEASLAEGPWEISLGVAPEKVDRAVEMVREEIGKIRSDQITDQEILAAKQYLIFSLPRQLESNAGICEQLINVEIFQLGEGYLSRFGDLIAAVPKTRLVDCWRTVLNFDQAALIIAGPYKPGSR